MKYFTNALPNFIFANSGTITLPLSNNDAFNYLTKPDIYADHDDNVIPRVWDKEIFCAIRHEELIEKINDNFSKLNGFLYNKHIKFKMPVCSEKSEIPPFLQVGDEILAALTVMPQRLGIRDKWTQEQINLLPVNFVLVKITSNF